MELLASPQVDTKVSIGHFVSSLEVPTLTANYATYLRARCEDTASWPQRASEFKQWLGQDSPVSYLWCAGKREYYLTPTDICSAGCLGNDCAEILLPFVLTVCRLIIHSGCRKVCHSVSRVRSICAPGSPLTSSGDFKINLELGLGRFCWSISRMITARNQKMRTSVWHMRSSTTKRRAGPTMKNS